MVRADVVSELLEHANEVITLGTMAPKHRGPAGEQDARRNPSMNFDKIFQLQTVELHSATERFFAETTASSSSPSRHTVLLLDVEGTTTPLPFVTKVLYPWSLVAFPEFCSENFNELLPAEITAAAKSSLPVKKALAAFESNSDVTTRAALIDVFVAHLTQLVESNNKAPYLKSIQGRIWRKGYESGDIKGHLFSDVGPTIRALHASGDASVHIFSSGSIQAQKLLFRHSTDGDLTPYISGYHDTVSAGPKFTPESYVKIRQSIAKQKGCEPSNVDIVFVTDIMAEVKAAAAADVTCVLSIRPLNHRLEADAFADGPHPLSLCTFAQLPGFPLTTERLSTSGRNVLRRLMLETDRYRNHSHSSSLKSFL